MLATKKAHLLLFAAVWGAGLVHVETAFAAASCPPGFPSKPIRVTVGFAAGAGTDATARAVSERIAEQQKWTIVVDNRPGNGGGAMLNQLKSQPADGYFIGVASTDAISFNPAAAEVGYTPDDFSYLGSAMQLLVGLVALKTKPFDDLASFLEFAKKNGRATISTGGPNQELLVKQLNEQYGTNVVAVPGTGAAEAMTAVLGGHVDASMQASLHVAHIKAGKMNQLASLIDRRVPYAPDSKTLRENGATAAPLELFTIFVAPKGLSQALKTCLGEALASAVTSPEFKTVTDKIDNEPINLGEAKLTDLVASRYKYYRQVLGR